MREHIATPSSRNIKWKSAADLENGQQRASVRLGQEDSATATLAATIEIADAANSIHKLAVVRAGMRLPVENPQRLHDIVEGDRRAFAVLPKLGRSLDGTGVRGPRREDSPLLAER